MCAVLQIDADTMSGVCFPDSGNPRVRVGYVLAPIVIAVCLGAVFSLRGEGELCIKGLVQNCCNLLYKMRKLP